MEFKLLILQFYLKRKILCWVALKAVGDDKRDRQSWKSFALTNDFWLPRAERISPNWHWHFVQEIDFYCYSPFLSLLSARFKGLRIAAVFGCLGTCLGAWVKVLGVHPDLFYVAFIGQSIVAASQVFILSLPAKLAAVWFGPNQVSSACSIGVFGNQVSVTTISYFMPWNGEKLGKNRKSLPVSKPCSFSSDGGFVWRWWNRLSAVEKLFVLTSLPNATPKKYLWANFSRKLSADIFGPKDDKSFCGFTFL